MSKSLEIVNEEIESINNQLNDYDEDDEEYGFYPSYDTLMYELNELETIKQDLEVLEIIKIKNVNLYSIKGFLNMHKKYSMSLEDVLKAYNLNYPKLTMEELLKLKQWLEENDNELGK